MKTLVSIPEGLDAVIEQYKAENYPDLTIPKILVRLLVEDIKRKEKERNEWFNYYWWIKGIRKK